MKTSRSRKQPRKCTFCGCGNLTKEHVWPAWAAELLPDAPQRAETLLLEDGPHATTEDLSRPGSLKHKKLRVVCKDCNNGWMSVLESDAKRVLLPMITGQSLFLDDPAQRLLARWIVLKVIVIEQARPLDAVITSEERAAFMHHQTMPERLSIEIACCGEPPWDTAMAGGSANLFPMELRPSDLVAARERKNIQTTTFGMGKLAAHCIVRSADAIDLAKIITFAKPLLTLWPLTGFALIWPPQPLAALEIMQLAARLTAVTKGGKVNYIA